METFANLEPEELVGWAFPCECGKTHRTALRALQIAPGALASLPAMLKTVNANRPFVLWDENTREAVGESARNALRIYPSFCYPAEPRPLPNERCLGQAVAAFEAASSATKASAAAAEAATSAFAKAAATAAGSAVTSALAGAPTGRTTAGLVGEAFGRVKLLLTGSEGETRATVATGEGLVHERHAGTS